MVLLLAAAGASADGFTGVYWWPDPDPMGASVGTAVTVQSGHSLDYEITSTDMDSAELWQDGVKTGDKGKFYDYTSYVSDEESPDINSCAGSWTVTATGFVGATWHREFHGVAIPMCEESVDKTDGWWFNDTGMLPPNEGGSRNDDVLGPLEKTVHITPSCGWIYGTVTYNGNPTSCTVQLLQGGQVRQQGYFAGGVYSFHHLAPGSYTAKALIARTGTADATVTAGAGTQADIAITFP